MTQPPFVAIYDWLVGAIKGLGIDAYSVSQEVPKHLPVCQVQMLNADPTQQFHNSREYSYTFQIDVIDGQNNLVRSLTNAYKVIDLCRHIQVGNCAVSVNGDPSLTSMVDTSTNQVLNRQIIRVNYNVIEDTAY